MGRAVRAVGVPRAVVRDRLVQASGRDAEIDGIHVWNAARAVPVLARAGSLLASVVAARIRRPALGYLVAQAAASLCAALSLALVLFRIEHAVSGVDS